MSLRFYGKQVYAFCRGCQKLTPTYMSHSRIFGHVELSECCTNQVDKIDMPEFALNLPVGTELRKEHLMAAWNAEWGAPPFASITT